MARAPWFPCSILMFACPLAGQTDDREVTTLLETWATRFDEPRRTLRLDDKLDEYEAERLLDTDTHNGLLAPLFGRGRDVSSRKTIEFLLERAERSGSPVAMRGALEIAAVGLQKNWLDRDARRARDLGHWCALRMRDQPGWRLVPLLAADPGSTEEAGIEIHRKRRHAVQIAALRLLGDNRDPDDLPILHVAAQSPVDTIRLAAIESIARARKPESLAPLRFAIAKEAHPIVLQATLNAIGQVVHHNAKSLAPEAIDAAFADAGAAMKRAGWHAAMSFVELAELHPSLESVPHLIDLIAPKKPKRRGVRSILRNPGRGVLEDRAYRTLKRLTGAILPIEDADGWRAFWRRERDNIVLISRDKWDKASHSRTSSGFFGIPVVGRETVFVIDVSNSMRNNATWGDYGGPSRLEAAAQQLMQAVQDMPKNWRFRVIFFHDTARDWQDRATSPKAQTMRALTHEIERIKPSGKTDYLAAMQLALGSNAKFAEQSKNTVEEVFLLSDGEPGGVDSVTDEEILAWVQEANQYRNIRINTILIGAKSGGQFLRTLAESNGGEFAHR